LKKGGQGGLLEGYSLENGDLWVKEGKKVKECIQVCLSPEDETTFQRETENLLKALDEFKLKRGAIITENKEDKIEVSGKRIEFIPLWKWIIEYSLRKD